MSDLPETPEEMTAQIKALEKRLEAAREAQFPSHVYILYKQELRRAELSEAGATGVYAYSRRTLTYVHRLSLDEAWERSTPGLAWASEAVRQKAEAEGLERHIEECQTELREARLASAWAQGRFYALTKEET